MNYSFLSKFSNLAKTIQPVSSTAQYGNTLPASQCPGGVPVDNYSGYGVNSWEVLYSIWNSYQSTIGAKFTQSQSNKQAPIPPESSIIGPKNIFIIRHGEKDKSTSNVIQYHLNQNGIYRACQIPTLINQLAVIGYPISYMVCSNPCPLNTADPSMRNQQTISMASFLLNIPTLVYGGNTETQAVADALFDSDPTKKNPFNGLNILICWEHTTIQDLCLKIMNKCYNNLVNRSTMDADTFFAQTSVSSQTCVGGQYLATAGNPPFSPSVTPPSQQSAATSVYPYWNNSNYDNMFCFLSNPTNTDFDFILANQQQFNCLTCYPSCELKIGLFQSMSNCTKTLYYYPNGDQLETECLPPTDWEV
jgi:hypothetical protein